MRVSTDQTASFSDMELLIPETELDTLDEFIDWQPIAGLLRAIQGDYCTLALFKMLLLQTWHNLSDASVSDAVKRDLVFMRFCGFSLEGNKPDATTLCRYRKRLVDAGLLDDLLRLVNDSLTLHDLKVSNGKYISSDATLIQSSRRARKVIESGDELTEVIYSDDTDATWLKKGDQCVYGYSASVTTDEAGLVESVTTFSAHRSEMTRLDDVLDRLDTKDGQVLLYDKGIDSAANRREVNAHGLKDGIMRKKPKGKPMGHWQRLRNKAISKRRFVVERTFGTLKRTYGLGRARYLSLVKTQAEVMIKSIAYNLKRGINTMLRRCSQAGCA